MERIQRAVLGRLTLRTVGVRLESSTGGDKLFHDQFLCGCENHEARSPRYGQGPFRPQGARGCRCVRGGHQQLCRLEDSSPQVHPAAHGRRFVPSARSLWRTRVALRVARRGRERPAAHRRAQPPASASSTLKPAAGIRDVRKGAHHISCAAPHGTSKKRGGASGRARACTRQRSDTIHRPPRRESHDSAGLIPFRNRCCGRSATRTAA